MKNAKVVILDSGIEKIHPIFEHINIEEFVYDHVIGKWEVRESELTNGHGTAVASVLVKYTKIDKLISFKITEDEDADLDILLSALHYIDQNIDCDVINLSMGVRTYDAALEEICLKLSEKGIVLVSAYANEDCVSYPAAFDCVIGVDSTSNLHNFKEYVYVKNSIVNIGCMKGVQRVAWLDGKYQLAVGNSFVTPLITAVICNLYSEGKNLKYVEDLLEERATKVIIGKEDEEKEKILFTMKNVALFPYNKEIKNVIKFADSVKFDIVSICDSRYSGNVGLKVGEEKYTIEDIEKFQYQNIDTFVIGHTNIIEAKTNKHYKQMILRQCKEKNINVISFDDMDIIDMDNIYYPKVFRDKYTTNKFGKLYDVNVPVLGVVGTSSQQGKFTLQMILRKNFLEAGYQIGQLSTEPEGCLFDVDEVFPYGYNSCVHLQGREFIEHVNAMIHKIDIKEPDIILLGSQSGTCTLTFEHVDMYNLPTMEFLLGARPDAVVLCVNYHDEIDDIKRSIKFIEGLVECRVIALSLFPMAYLNEWKYLRNIKEKVPNEELEEKRCELEHATGVSAFILGREEQEVQMFDQIIDFFAE